MKHLDLFSGIGGFTEGFKRAGLKHDWHGCSEIDKYAKSIYKKHYPDAEDLGNVTTIELDRIPDDLDLVTFGFPCQDLSVAGKRGGLEAARSGLFYEAMQIIRAKRPSYFIFENVKGLYSSNDGRDFALILREIADSGYDGQWQLLNTRWVLPQNRERIYFVGHLRGQPRPEIFPIGESSEGIDEAQREAQGEGQRLRSDNPQCAGSLRVGGGDTKDLVANCMSARYGKDGSENLIAIGETGKNSQGCRVYSPEGCSATINSGGGGLGAKTGLYQVPRGYNKGGIKDECGAISSSAFEHNNFVVPVLTPDRAKKRQNGRRFKGDGDPSFTLTGQDNHGVATNTGIRRLTPIECERLQGFPSYRKHVALDLTKEVGWTSYGKKGEEISDSQRYKCLGNAVTVDIVSLLAQKLKPYIEGAI